MLRIPLSLFAAYVLTIGCATSHSVPAPGNAEPAAQKQPERAVISKVNPIHRALVPNLPSPDFVQTELKKDFNGDGVLDLALVIRPPSDHPLQADDRQRTLVMGIREGSSFRAIQSTECVAMCPQCGGIMGDPYQGMETDKKGRLTVRNYGGSRQRWSVSYTIAWHKDAFQIVGVSRSSFDSLRPEQPEEVRLDLLTGTTTSTNPKAAKTHTFGPIPIEGCEAIEGLR